MEGPDAVDAVVGQLEGFEAPAGAWETEILPARVHESRFSVAQVIDVARLQQPSTFLATRTIGGSESI
jgi:hypothetical protein